MSSAFMKRKCLKLSRPTISNDEVLGNRRSSEKIERTR